MKLFASPFTFLAGVVLMAALAACGPAAEPTATPTQARAVATPTSVTIATPAAKQPKYGGIAVLAHRRDIPTSDPMVGGSDIDIDNPLGPVYGNGALLKPCREDVFQICPFLAEKWESNADFTVWTFQMRDNVLWHDGKPFTAEDARWWLDLALNGAKGRKPSIYAPRFGPIASASAEGNKLRITLSKPSPSFPAFVSGRGDNNAHPRHLMQPEIDKGNATVTPQDVGWVATGPFKMLKYERGSVVQVRRFDKYWEKDKEGRQLPFLDGVDFAIMTDPNAIIAALRTGRIDGSARGSGYFLNPEQREPLKREMGDKIQIYVIPAYDKIIGVNSRRAPWSDVRVRQAAELWMDRPSGIQAVHGGDGLVWAAFPIGSPYGNPDFMEWPGYNPKTKEADRKRAKELLAEAGFPNGFKVTILCRETWVAFCEWEQGQFNGLLGQGNARIDVTDTPTYNLRVNRGEFEITAPSGSDRLWPWDLAPDYLTTNTNAKAQHNDKKVDEYFDRIASAKDQAEMVKLTRELERYIVLDQALTINVWVEMGGLAFRDYVKGWPVPKWGTSNNTDQATTWLDK